MEKVPDSKTWKRFLISPFLDSKAISSAVFPFCRVQKQVMGTTSCWLEKKLEPTQIFNNKRKKGSRTGCWIVDGTLTMSLLFRSMPCQGRPTILSQRRRLPQRKFECFSIQSNNERHTVKRTFLREHNNVSNSWAKTNEWSVP